MKKTHKKIKSKIFLYFILLSFLSVNFVLAGSEGQTKTGDVNINVEVINDSVPGKSTIRSFRRDNDEDIFEEDKNIDIDSSNDEDIFIIEENEKTEEQKNDRANLIKIQEETEDEYDLQPMRIYLDLTADDNLVTKDAELNIRLYLNDWNLEEMKNSIKEANLVIRDLSGNEVDFLNLFDLKNNIDVLGLKNLEKENNESINIFKQIPLDILPGDYYAELSFIFSDQFSGVDKQLNGKYEKEIKSNKIFFTMQGPVVEDEGGLSVMEIFLGSGSAGIILYLLLLLRKGAVLRNFKNFVTINGLEISQLTGNEKQILNYVKRKMFGSASEKRIAKIIKKYLENLM